MKIKDLDNLKTDNEKVSVLIKLVRKITKEYNIDDRNIFNEEIAKIITNIKNIDDKIQKDNALVVRKIKRNIERLL